MKLVIWWVRRVIRLQDNPVVEVAIRDGLPILPLYIFNPLLLGQKNTRSEFLLSAICGLEEELKKFGGELLSVVGSAPEVFSALSRQVEIHNVVTEKEITLYGKQMEAAVSDIVPLETVQAITVFPSGAVKKPDGGSYQKYTAYRNAWLKLPLPAASKYTLLHGMLADIRFSLPFQAWPDEKKASMPYGSIKALSVLTKFLSGPAKDYAVLRDRIDLDDTSHCSHLFRFGILSPRETVEQVQKRLLESSDEEANRSYQIWMNELIWREFFNHLMDSYSSKEERYANKDGSVVQWRESDAELRTWQLGMTGYPLIDAAMRQLKQTGWMPNRVRMVVASFLVKDLFLWWHHGENWFMQHLLDGDPAANHGNWQWAAGIGTDAAPYFRVFNPITQSKKFDPHASYIRTWLPELSKVDDAFIHEPWTMNIQDQVFHHCKIGTDYPAPMVDHKAARLRALDLFNKRQKRGQE
jgi:deoxyribodipyrimidine photo-lyase